MMKSYEQWLKGKPELEILHLLGLFDRPADPEALQELRTQPSITGVTTSVCALTDEQWKYAVKHLRDLRLIDKPQPESINTLDCHPLIREHFGSSLKMQHAHEWEKAHERLFHHYVARAERAPPATLQEMEPVFRAIVHGCQSTKIEEALDLYVLMIQRDNETNYCCKVLGAIGADLAILSAFFEAPWTMPSERLDPKLHGVLVQWAGYRLKALGRIREARECVAVSQRAFASCGDSANATFMAHDLCHLLLLLGDVPQAVEYAKWGVANVRPSNTGVTLDDLHSMLGHALHQSGDYEKAETAFRQAEDAQKVIVPQSHFLFSVRGFFYCELLLDQGRWDEVLGRARESLRFAESVTILLDIALAELTIGKNAMLSAQSHTDRLMTVAERHLSNAVQKLRESGANHYLPRGLLARANLHRLTGRFSEASRDLNELFEVVDRSEMKLFLADFHLETARLALTENRLADASKHCGAASVLVRETGYARRRPELDEIQRRLTR